MKSKLINKVGVTRTLNNTINQIGHKLTGKNNK